MNALVTLIVAIGLAVTLALSHMILKRIANEGDDSLLHMFINHHEKFILALTLYFFVFVAYSIALRQMSLSILYPVYTGLSMLCVVAIGVWVFNERLVTAQYVGIIFILLGISLLSMFSGSEL